jgi:ABC-type phosphate/phosphonate transport system substrate-binding protein
MYDVTPDVRQHWHALMLAAGRNAGVPIECIDHAAPASLTDLWSRDDLALAFVCGFPLATRFPQLRPLAAPIIALAQRESPTYNSVWLVRADSAFDTLASTFGHRIGWTVEHSHSGFNAPRHALLAHRSSDRSSLFREAHGPLGHPRAALAALRDGRIDVTAIDAYWWWLLRQHDAKAASAFRAIGHTVDAPMPPLACSAELPDAESARLVTALAGLHQDSAMQQRFTALGIRRFAARVRADYAPLAALERAALDAGYPLPA